MSLHQSSHRVEARSIMSSIGNIASSIACILGLGLVATTAQAQAVFQGGTLSFNTSAGPQGVAVADLNRDGKPDSIVADTTAGQLSVLLSGAGGYAVTTYTVGASPVAVATVSNFADSGLPAVAVVQQGANNVAIYTDSATGSLTLDTTYATGAAPTAITTGDFNNDGVPDLAVSYPGGVTILLGSRTGAFTSGAGATVGTDLVALAAGHFDSTANLDLAVVDQAANQVDILVGNGAGGFTVGSPYAVGSKPTCVAVGSFNTKGKMDLAVGNYTSGTVSVLLGNGDDTFQGQLPYAAGGTVQGIVTSDINSDGNPDIIVTNAANGTSGNTIGVLVGMGNGSFAPALTPTLIGSPYGLATMDFNRDGRPGLVVTQNTGNTMSILVNNTLVNALPGGRNYQAPTQIGQGNMGVAAVTADFNGDGIPDVAVAYFEDYTVGVMFGNGDGTFQTQALYAVGKHPYSLAVADLNHDGHPDLVTANENDGTVSVLLNNGTGGFGAQTTFNVGRLPTGVAIGDVNNDGFPDLAVANYGGNTVSILLGNGSGGFTPGVTLAGQTNPYNVAIGDFNGDGKQDVAFTNFKSGTAEVYLGNGDGTFSFDVAPTIPSLPGGGGSAPVGSIEPSSIATGDFNRDGNLDFAVGTAGGNTIAIFLGDGSGGFSSSAVQTLNFPISIAVGDINNDGIPDIVNVDPNYNFVSVLQGKGDGTFTARWQFPTTTTANNSKNTQNPGQQPWGIALADFNLDGRLDIVTSNTIAQVNLTIPAYQPVLGATVASPAPVSTSILLNNSGVNNVLSVSPNGGNIPDTSPVTLTAQITPALSGSTPTGAVIFEDTSGTELGGGSGGPAVPLVGGTASLTLKNLGSGIHYLSSLYSGDVNYQPNTTVGGNIVVAVQGTPVTVTVVPNTLVFQSGNLSDVTVTVFGTNNMAPTGTATIYAYTPGGQLIPFQDPYTGNQKFPLTPSGNGDSQAQLQIFDPQGVLTVGTYEFFAFYNGDTNYPTGSSANEPLTITQATPTVKINCFTQGKFGSNITNQVCQAQVIINVNNAAPLFPPKVQVQAGTVTFSINGGPAVQEQIQNNGGFRAPNYYAEYTFPTPADIDADGDIDYKVTATFTPAAGDNNLTTASATLCVGGCNSSGSPNIRSGPLQHATIPAAPDLNAGGRPTPAGRFELPISRGGGNIQRAIPVGPKGSSVQNPPIGRPPVGNPILPRQPVQTVAPGDGRGTGSGNAPTGVKPGSTSTTPKDAVKPGVQEREHTAPEAGGKLIQPTIN